MLTVFISKFAIALISPLGTALLLGIFALLLGVLRHSRMSLAVGAIALAWLSLWSLPAMSLWLRSKIESAFPMVPVQELPDAEAIVVLGGTMEPPQNIQAFPDLLSSADRVWHAMRIYRAGKAPLLVLSGGSDSFVSLTSEAESMRLMLRDFGVPEKAMILEGASRNTRENARFTAKLLRDLNVDTVLLVTSALHMKRAMAHFRAEGLNVIPAATDHEGHKPTQWQRWLPDTNALDGSGRAMKEIIGSLFGS